MRLGHILWWRACPPRTTTLHPLRWQSPGPPDHGHHAAIILLGTELVLCVVKLTPGTGTPVCPDTTSTPGTASTTAGHTGPGAPWYLLIDWTQVTAGHSLHVGL